MGNVWMIVLGTMIVTALCSFAWHETGMRSVREQNARAIAEVRADIEAYTAYRDVVKENGKEAGAVYLEQR